MPPIRRSLGSIALVAALSVAGAACGSSSSSASFCDTVKNQKSELSKPDMSNKDSLKKSAASFKSLASRAPSEIKADMKLLSDYLDKIANVDLTDSKAAGEVMKGVDSAKISKAGENIDAYIKKTCKVDISS